MVTQFLTRMQCANISAKDLADRSLICLSPTRYVETISRECETEAHTTIEEELKRKLRERQAEALAALQKRSGYQMKEKRDKGLLPLRVTCTY